MKVALVYDRVNKWGGAERVLLALHEMFPDAPLYTSVYNPKTASWARVFSKVVPTFLQKFPFRRHEWMAPLMPIAFENLNFDEFDLVISVTSEAAKGIITKSQTKHICYCLTPTRYLWSGYKDYFKWSIFRSLMSPIVKYLRDWDTLASTRPDLMVAISTISAKRIEKYYGRESKIIFPPVEVGKFKREEFGKAIDKYFLIVSRLVPYKKIDLAIEVFNKLGRPLVIVGTGSEEFKFKFKSKKNIKLLGQVSNKKLIEIYKGARALIMPQEEDFGIVSVEAQAVGIPVIAYKKGGAFDTVIEGKTGIFFEEQTVESLTSAVKKFDNDSYLDIRPEYCIKNAQRFSKERFKEEFLKICMS